MSLPFHLHSTFISCFFFLRASSPLPQSEPRFCIVSKHCIYINDLLILPYRVHWCLRLMLLVTSTYLHHNTTHTIDHIFLPFLNLSLISSSSQIPIYKSIGLCEHTDFFQKIIPRTIRIGKLLWSPFGYYFLHRRNEGWRLHLHRHPDIGRPRQW